jgi:hypothetical protein
MGRPPIDPHQIALDLLHASRSQLGRRLPAARRKIDEAIAIIFAARPDLAAFYAAVRRARRKAKRVNPLEVATK